MALIGSSRISTGTSDEKLASKNRSYIRCGDSVNREKATVSSSKSYKTSNTKLSVTQQNGELSVEDIKLVDKENKVSEHKRDGSGKSNRINNAKSNIKNSNNSVSAKGNSLPKVYNYRDNPKYFFYSYTGDSSKEIPLAKLANSKSNLSLKSAASNKSSTSSSKSITKSASSKSLSTKKTAKDKCSGMTKSSSSSSRLSGNNKRSSSGSRGVTSSIKSSSSNKSIASTASTSSGSSLRSLKSSSSSNSTSSFKSAVSSQSSSGGGYQPSKYDKCPSSSAKNKASKYASFKNVSCKSKSISSKSNSFSLKYEALSNASSTGCSQVHNNFAPASLRIESMFSKSPSPTYNSLDSNSSSKYDTLSSKSSREGSLSRDFDVSSCSSSSASTATIRSYRSLLPASLRGETYKQSKEKMSSSKEKKSIGVNSNFQSLNNDSGFSPGKKNSDNFKSNEKGINVGKDLFEKAIKGNKYKTKLSKGIKGVRWKEDEWTEDNNNTPAKKPKQAHECRKDGILKMQYKMFAGRQYCRLK